ncbi:MAG: hypothetical protein JWN52_2257 [Actinomycetia bacterium]|nr:hypothetical protein [Actinomycetes bacterium]
MLVAGCNPRAPFSFGVFEKLSHRGYSTGRTRVMGVDRGSVPQPPFGLWPAVEHGGMTVRRSAAASRSCVCGNDTIEGGCCCRGRGRVSRPEIELLGRLRSCLARAEPWLQAGEVRRCAGLRAAEAQRLDDRRARGGSHAGPDPAAAQPRRFRHRCHSGRVSPPPDPGMIPLTIPEIKRLLAALLFRPCPPGHATHWLNWRRRHQARSRWYHQYTRLAGDCHSRGQG